MNDSVKKTERKRPLAGAAAMGAGPGRPKGVPNRVTGELKTMILQALDGAGGVEYLQEQASKNPGAFMSLIGKVLPMTVQHSGHDGGPMVIVTGIPTASDAAKDD